MLHYLLFICHIFVMNLYSFWSRKICLRCSNFICGIFESYKLNSRTWHVRYRLFAQKNKYKKKLSYSHYIVHVMNVTELDMGRVHPWVGSGRVRSTRSESDRTTVTVAACLDLLSFSQFGSVGAGFITCLLLNVDWDWSIFTFWLRMS